MENLTLGNPAWTLLLDARTHLASADRAFSHIRVSATNEAGSLASPVAIELWHDGLVGSMNAATGVLTGATSVITVNAGETNVPITGRETRSGAGKYRQLWGRAKTAGTGYVRFNILGI